MLQGSSDGCFAQTEQKLGRIGVAFGACHPDAYGAALRNIGGLARFALDLLVNHNKLSPPG
jgi:hypothetical protein